jgi:dTDP-glucose pyrophosphorylase
MSIAEKIWRQSVLSPTATVGEAVRVLDLVAIKIVLIVNELGVLEGTISDGDIRRGLLKGFSLASPIENVIHRNALVVLPEVSREVVTQLMIQNKIQQIPIVDNGHRVLGLHLWDAIATPPIRPNLMVIMAGGLGTRLRPYTEACPKPLVKVNGKPMLEHIVERAKFEGFRHFIIITHHLGHMIEEYFGDGARLGVRMEYIREESPLGTAGGLSLLDPLPSSPFLISNGDVVTDIRYGGLLDFHVRHVAMGTMAVRLYEWQHPFGVVQIDGVEIAGFEEKPLTRSHVNAGIYVLDPRALSLLEKDVQCDMPTLFERLRASLEKTVAYPMHEPWLDVGRPEDLELATLQFKNIR